jgi:hypothetical protein
VPTECIPEQLEFQGLGLRKVVADFSGGRITSDAGGLLLREIATGTGILERFADCFSDNRNQELIEHTKLELLSQRVLGIALGYEDLNDHDDLRGDALLATLVGKIDPSGESRVRKRDRGYPLAGKSTLNRLELAPAGVPYTHRYHKILCDPDMVDRFFVDTFLRTHTEAPERIILDFDATDDPLHGGQEGRFFNGYYDCYCYMPLYVFCGDHLLCARLRPSNVDASLGSEAELERIVGQIREQWRDVQIILRADSGFCRSELMDWCDAHDVDYILGMSRSSRLVAMIAKQLKKAKKRFWKTQEPARYYRDFRFRTRTSWSRARRVIGKAEQIRGKANPRFVETSLSKKDVGAQELYHVFRQSPAPVVFRRRVRADDRASSGRPQGHQARSCSVHDDPQQASQDRRSGLSERAASLGQVCWGLPLPGALRPSPLQSTKGVPNRAHLNPEPRIENTPNPLSPGTALSPLRPNPRDQRSDRSPQTSLSNPETSSCPKPSPQPSFGSILDRRSYTVRSAG